MRKVGFHFAKVLRLFIGVFLLVILVIVAINFISHSKKQLKIPMQSKAISQKKIEKKERIEYVEDKGGKRNRHIQADRHYLGKDGLYHVEGNVKIVFLKKKDGQDVFLYGDEIVYDKEGSHFLVRGQARIEFKDLRVKSSFLEYDTREEVIKSDEGINFSSQRVTGSAQHVVYSLKKAKIELLENIRLQLWPNLDTSLPLEIQADKFDYLRKKRHGTLEGGVLIFHGDSCGMADFMEFDLVSTGEQIKSLLLKGNVRLSLIAEEGKKEQFQKQASLFLYNKKRDFKADEIFIKGFWDLPQIQNIKAKGDCDFKFTSLSGSFTRIQAEAIEFGLNREGKFREFHSNKNVRIFEQGERAESQRIIEGEIIYIKGKKNILMIEGKDRSKPRILSEGSEISADSIIVFLDNNNLEAKEGVKLILNPRRASERSVGFFSKEKPVFITSREMRYSEAEKRFLFSEDIKVWQGKEMLIAKELSIYNETGKILCGGGVKSILPYTREGSQEEEKIEISAYSMNFDPEKNLIAYQEKSSLKLKNLNMSAQSIFVHLTKEKGEMETIVAYGKVIINQNQLEGKGEEARYDVNSETLDLLGTPVINDKKKGKIEGFKLTFYMADGRIVVENKDRERSVITVKK